MGSLDRLAYRREPEADVATQMAAAFEAARLSDHATALAIWRPLAQAGVARAQNNVSACFSEGLGVARDPALALDADGIADVERRAAAPLPEVAP